MKKMMKINDEDVRGDCYHSFRLPNDADNLTVRDLIKLRVETEVMGFNMRRPLCFYTLVQPQGAELTPKGYRLKTHRNIDWRVQYEAALAAFEENRFLISVAGSDRQSLEDVIDTSDFIEINFVKFNEIIAG